MNMEVYYYQEEIEIQENMLSDGKLTNHAILSLFQEVAGKHAVNLKIDYVELNKLNLMWVVVRNRHVVLKQPTLHEKVIVSTWPHRTNRFEFDREYQIKSLDGTVYVKGDSKWCVLNQTTRRIVATTEILMEGNFLDVWNFETPLKQIPNMNFEPIKVSYSAIVQPTQIDQNHHLNNTEYATMIDAAIRPYNLTIQSFEINFVKETKLNEQLDFKILEMPKEYYIEGSCEGQVRVKAKIGI